MENERKNELEAELRVLHSRLDASSSDVGDWNLSKIVEGLIDACASSSDDSIKSWAASCKVNLDAKISERKGIRARINEIEEELNKLVD